MGRTCSQAAADRSTLAADAEDRTAAEAEGNRSTAAVAVEEGTRNTAVRRLAGKAGVDAGAGRGPGARRTRRVRGR